MSIKTFLLRFLIHRPLEIGMAAPYLSLTAHDGTWVRSEDLEKNTLYLLFFFPSFSDNQHQSFLTSIDSLHTRVQHHLKNNETKDLNCKFFGITDQNITILRAEVEKRNLNFPLLYDPFAIESRRFGLSKRRLRCTYGYVLVNEHGTCMEYERGIPNWEHVFKQILSNLSTHSTTDENPENISSDELVVGFIDSQEAEMKTKEHYRIIDVRTLPEYEADHIPESIHIPLDDLHSRHAELDPLKELLFICQTGTRATAGAEFITSIGGQNIFVVQGGMSEWNGERITGGKR